MTPAEAKIAQILLIRTFWDLKRILRGTDLDKELRIELECLLNDINHFQNQYDARRGIHSTND